MTRDPLPSFVRGILACGLAAFALLLAGPLSAAGPIVLRTSMTPESPWVGQRVILRFEVLGPDAWAQITRFGELEIPGAYVIRDDGSGSRLQETIDGNSYSGQRYEWSVYPQRAGTLEIPPIEVQVEQKTFGADAKESTSTMATPTASIECRLPPGADKIRGLISSSQLKATQSWDPLPGEELKVGNAVKRTIRLEATDVSGMAFTPSPPPTIDGVGIYPTEPVVEDESNRGTLTGSRIESVTYVFESPGQVQLPDQSIRWWNTQTETLEEVKLPGVSIVVTGPPTPTPSQALATPSAGSPWMWIMGSLAVVTLLAAAFLFRHRLQACWTSWLESRRCSEAAKFRLLTTTIRSGSNEATLRELMRWIDAINPEPEPACLGEFLDRHGDQESRALTLQLSSPFPSSVDPHALERSLSAARRRWIADRKQRKRTQRASQVLPPLNTRS